MDTSKIGSDERSRLDDLYSLESDEKLLHLRLSYEDLTEVAQAALHDELTKRRLWSTEQANAATEEHPYSVSHAPAFPHLGNNSISVWECKTQEEAEVVCHLLQLASINAVARPLRSKTLQIVQVHVDRDAAERALTILSNGVPGEIVKELAAQFTSYAFVTPICRSCNSHDVALDSVGTTNHWSCGKCGSQWEEDLDNGNPDVFSESELRTTGLLEDSDLEAGSDIVESSRERVAKSNRRSIGYVVLGTLLAVIASWYQPWTMFRIFGLCVFIPSETLLILARIQLGASFSIRAEARKLITHGLYSHIQNPIYLFGGLTLAGLILFLNRPLYLFVFLVIIPIQFFRISQEREILIKTFGKSYLKYREQTWF
jgi:protein-S-isoprenylcysteine O-methyltransferase Ste14